METASTASPWLRNGHTDWTTAAPDGPILTSRVDGLMSRSTQCARLFTSVLLSAATVLTNYFRSCGMSRRKCQPSVDVSKHVLFLNGAARLSSVCSRALMAFCSEYINERPAPLFATLRLSVGAGMRHHCRGNTSAPSVTIISRTMSPEFFARDGAPSRPAVRRLCAFPANPWIFV